MAIIIAAMVIKSLFATPTVNASSTWLGLITDKYDSHGLDDLVSHDGYADDWLLARGWIALLCDVVDAILFLIKLLASISSADSSLSKQADAR